MSKRLRDYVQLEPQATIVALKTVDATAFLSGVEVQVIENRSLYVWEATASDTANDDEIVDPTLPAGNGRWFKIATNLEDFFLVDNSASSTTTYTATWDAKLSALKTGQRVYFKPIASNTGASTLNINGIGAIPIRHADNTEIAANEMIGGSIVHMVYNAGKFEIVNQSYDAGLQSFSLLATAGDKFGYTTATNTWAESDITAFARTLLDDPDAATARATLGAAASTLADGDVFIGSPGNVATAQTLTGDMSLANTGAVTAEPALITGKPVATVAPGDLVQIADVSAANALSQTTAQDIANLAPPGSSARELFIQAGVTEIAGKVYNTYANALVYINANGGSSFFNRWVCTIVGQVTGNIAMQAYVYVSGKGNSGVLIGDITASATTNAAAHYVEEVQCDSVFPGGANTVIECRNCRIVSQDNSAAQGTIWVRQGTYMDKDAANPDIDFTNLTLEVTEGAQVSDMGSFATINVRTGGYVTFAGAASGSFLNLYDGAATVSMQDNTTISLTGGLFCYTGNLYSSGFGFGTNGIISVAGGITNDVINATTYGVNLVSSGAGTTIYVCGYYRGQARTETITTAAGGAITYEGTYMGPQSGNVITGDDTIANILALDAKFGLTDTQIYVGSAGNVATGVAMSGDTNIANTGAVTAQPALITGKPAATVASGDLVMVADVDDTDALKQVTAQSIANLAATGNTFDDSVFRVFDNADNTKNLAFEVSGVTTATTRTVTIQDADGTMAYTADLAAYQPLDADLTAIAALAGTGIAVRTAADTWAQRTITGTANEISVADGDGVAGNPTLSLPAVIDLGGKTSLEIPNGTGPTTNVAGQIALDTNGDGATVTQGVLQAFDGTQNVFYFGADAYPTTDGQVMSYASATNKVVWTSALTSTLSDGNIFVGDATNTAASVSMSGDMNIINTGATTAQPALISGKTEVVAATGDSILFGDVSDAGNLKRDTIAGLLDLYADFTATLTNKTFDANGTGNSISNIDVADLADGTDGELITWDAAGAPTTVGAGTSGQVLQSQGAGSVPVFANQIYDIPFNAGFAADGTTEDVVVQTYGEMVVARSGSFTGEAGYADVAPTGADLILDIEKNGTSIYTTPPEFAATSQTLTAGTLKADGTEDFVSGDRITFKITQIGSTEPGEGVRFTVQAGAR